MARYDGQYGGPRGGWRGGERGPGGQGFRFGQQGPPRFNPGPQWSQGYDPGAHGDGRGYGGDFGRGPGSGAYGGYGPGQQGGWSGRYATPPRRPDGLVGGGGDGPRGEYGAAYEEYGGWPGGPRRGQDYGGRGSQGRGYDAGWGGQGGFAREPFMPDEAYRRHPEYRQQPQPREWEAYQHELGEEPGDDQVRDSVYRRMRADAWLDPERINVQVEDGVVTLTGEVDDFLKARYAWDDAWEADGVRGVVNQLTVRADQPQTTHGDVVPQSAGGGTTADEAGAS
jgi:hypothetical protein